MFNLEALIYGMFVKLTYLFRPRIKIGQKVILFGGHETNPRWLGNDQKKDAIVINYIPSSNKGEQDLLIKFDKPFEIENNIAKFAILKLRYVDAKWHNGEICDIEIYDFEPEIKAIRDGKQGKRIESHASIRIAK